MDGPGANDQLDARASLDDFEEAVERLRVAYDKYFAGIDKVSPVRLREQVQRQWNALEAMHVRSTMLRFRLGGLRARFVTYKHYWTRVEREIERGVSRRDLLRLRRAEPSLDTNGSREIVVAPSPSHDVAGLDLAHLHDVFEQLVRAKREAGESLDGLTFSAMCRKLSREAPKFRARHQCESVRFEVSIADGKVRLRARPVGTASP